MNVSSNNSVLSAKSFSEISPGFPVFRTHGGSKARVNVCGRYYGKTVKLFWLNEDRKGVYFGFFGRASGAHFSYHTDGNTHVRLQDGTKIEERTIQRIEDINAFQDLQLATLNISEETVRIHGEELAPSGTPSTNIFIGGDHADAAPTTLNVSHTIVSGNAEAAWIAHVNRLYKDRGWTVVGLVLIPLAFFPGHTLAIKVTQMT